MFLFKFCFYSCTLQVLFFYMYTVNFCLIFGCFICISSVHNQKKKNELEMESRFDMNKSKLINQ